MSRILNHQSNIVALRELYSSSHVVDPGHVDGVTNVITKLASLVCGCEWIAGLVLEVRIHKLGGVVDTANQGAMLVAALRRKEYIR